MDEERFDRLTRTLAAGNSRRGLLKGLTRTAIGGAAAFGLRGVSAAPAERYPPKAGYFCPAGTTPCAVVNNRSGVRNLVSCCGAGEVCYKCSGAVLSEGQEPGNGADFFTSTAQICCTPGVNCPGDPEAYFPTANGRRLDFCSLN